MNRRVTMKEVSQTIIDQMGEAKPEA
jgi:AmiR/NasT family two-component response regulator